MVLATWGQALVGVVYGLFALRLLQRARWRLPGDRANALVLLTILFSSLWGWSELVLLLTDKPQWLLASRAMDVLRYAGWFTFFLLLLRPGRKTGQQGGFRWLEVIAAGLVLVALVSLLLSYLDSHLLGDLGRLHLMVSMAAPVFSLVLLEQVFRNATEDSRWSIKPLSLGLLGVFLFDLYLFSQAVMFNRINFDALNIRGAVHALVAPLLMLSISRRTDWTSKIQVSPKAAFHSATLLIAGLYLLFMSAVGYYVRYFGGEWGPALQVGLLFFALISLLVLAMSGAVRASLKVFLGKHFFRYRYDYREEWLKFTRALSNQGSPQGMELQVIRGLADMLESPGGCLWLRDKGDMYFNQTARWNMPEVSDTEDALSSMCEFMRSSNWVINLEEYRSFVRRYENMTLPVWLQYLPHAWLVVPLMVGSELIGFVMLANARTTVDVNWEVNDLLKTAGQQAASYLAQMRATEALLEVRKFDAFNRMSAFVVHDLKNIITQLSLMMKSAKRLGSNPEFQRDMLETVENSLERMRQLMLQLREGATPHESMRGVNLSLIVDRIASVAAGRGRVLEIEHKDPAFACGHEERLERIIGHVVQNALDATDPSGNVWLSLNRVGSQVRLTVGDTGQGMSPEFIRDRLFKPFQTTKQSGMGIGAFETFQYVRELGGKIEVTSEVGLGTRVTVLLPVFEAQQDSGLHTSKSL